jgi:hypothetical protein
MLPEPLPPLTRLIQLASDIMAKKRSVLPGALARIKQVEQAVEDAERAVQHARTPAGVAEYLKHERARPLRTAWAAMVRGGRFILPLYAWYLLLNNHYLFAVVVAVTFVATEHQERTKLLQEAERAAQAESARIAGLAEAGRAELEHRLEDLVLLTTAILNTHDARLAAAETGLSGKGAI